MSKQDEKLEQKSPEKSEIKCSGALHDTDLEKVTGGDKTKVTGAGTAPTESIALHYGAIEWTYTKQ